jgi:hypothetical protein
VAPAVRILAGEYGADENKALLKVGFENAFNFISRQAFLEEVARELPGLARWVHWCYGQPAHLWAEGETLQSSSGVRQGDPLGPLLFSLVLRRVCVKLSEKYPDLDLNVWYLDDGAIVGSRVAVATTMQDLASPEVQGLGLHVNLDKCEVWWPSGSHGFPELPPQVQRMSCEGVEILKIPVATDEYVAGRLQAAMDAARRVLDRLHLLGDPQAEVTLLRSCLGASKLVYRLRGTPVQRAASRSALADIEGALRVQFERILGRSLSDDPGCRLGSDQETEG